VVFKTTSRPGTSIFAVASSEMQRVINAADLMEGKPVPRPAGRFNGGWSTMRSGGVAAFGWKKMGKMDVQ